MRFLFGLVLLFFYGCSALDQDGSIVKLEEGQVWTFKDAPLVETRLTIRRLSYDDEGSAVHVSIAPVPLRQTSEGRVVGGLIAHLPFSRDVLLDSLLNLEPTDAAPMGLFEEGYQEWLDANGGIFSIPPSEAIEYVYVITGATEPAAE